MDGKMRRQQIIRELSRTSHILSGSALASKMGVSRQVIVQDIALLRTEYPILATAKGYVLYDPTAKKCVRVYLVKHTCEQIQDELSSIVDLGGRVLDVIVEHDVYGQLRADLNLTSAADVDSFCRRLENSACGPIFPISQGLHLHTVEASSEKILDEIEDVLEQKGYLVK